MKDCLRLIIWAVTFTTLWLVSASRAGAQQPPSAHVRQSAGDISNLVGAETCALCHASISDKFADNPHSRLALSHGGQGVTCESCHGAGKAHVESGGDPTKIRQMSKLKPMQVDATCLNCHAQAHPNFERSPHAKAQVGCTSCHSIHGFIPVAAAVKAASATVPVPSATASVAPTTGPAMTPDTTPSEAAPLAPPAPKKAQLSARLIASLKTDGSTTDPTRWNVASLETPGENPSLLKAPQPQLCYQCHNDVKPAFAQPFHHKVDEGLLKCTDCHDAHGTFGNNNIRSTADQNAVCTKCHTETRGPFVFEHVPVKAEGCVSCHTPHGSQNARLLNVPNINQMCNQCHSPVAAGTVHGQGAGSAVLTSCINCHTMIHGSNVNPAFIR
jgi:predicted CXXCH cytochrome family protein